VANSSRRPKGRGFLGCHERNVRVLKKRELKKALGDGKKYRKHKEKFIENILRKALK